MSSSSTAQAGLQADQDVQDSQQQLWSVHGIVFVALPEQFAWSVELWPRVAVSTPSQHGLHGLQSCQEQTGKQKSVLEALPVQLGADAA